MDISSTMEIQSETMEIPATMENSHPQINPSDDGPSLDHSNIVPDPLNANGGGDSEPVLSAEEVVKELETIASTGKFWHDWEVLQKILHFQLKQVLSGYSEATMADVQQCAALGESYPHLVKRMEEALFRFIEGPPFTVQRLCEILLHARTIYPNLSKLALALEKTLLVTSTLTKSTDPYPTSIVPPLEQIQDTHIQPPSQPETQNESEHQQQCAEPQQPHSDSNSVENGAELTRGDGDEVMSEVDAKVDEGMQIDMVTFEEIIRSPDANSEPPSNS